MDRLGDVAYSITNCAPKLDAFFWYSSARIWGYTRSIAAYQNNLVLSENDDVTGGSMSYDSSRERVKQSKMVYHDKSYSFETDFG